MDDADRKRYKDLAARVERIGRRRNDVVHGLWSIKKDQPDVVFLHIPYPRTQEEAEPVAYGKDKFKRLILDLEALRADVGKFRSHLSDLAKAEPFPRSFLIVNE